MATSIKDAYDKALRKMGGEPIKQEGAERLPAEHLGQFHANTRDNPGILDALLKSSNKALRNERVVKNVKVTNGHVSEQPRRSRPKVQLATPAKPSSRQMNVPSPAVAPSYTMDVSREVTFLLATSAESPVALLAGVEAAGRVTQCHLGETDEQREVVLGLDFGTSCVKVVIGDSADERAYAVPFCEAHGINRFLLPSRVRQTGQVFCLAQGTHTHQDLKLALLATLDDPVRQARVVAFLALVIRRARGWLFAEHSAKYEKTEIAWKLQVGLPASQHFETDLSRTFERLSLAAWSVAGAPDDVSEALIASALDDAAQAHSASNDVEIDVIPEIAAQIYGFVVSASFDKKAPNIYLMADVGAGTIDSSLFFVKPGKGQRWDFEFFTSVVEPHGVRNLHRHRANWWAAALTKAQAPRSLLDGLEARSLETDQELPVPETFRDYFNGIEVHFDEGIKTPDQAFFTENVSAQVRGKTFYQAWESKVLDRHQCTNVPFFGCGGGMRMEYYQALTSDLESIDGSRWFGAVPRKLEVPDDLIANGISEHDYDRLSVAYGLSRLEVGNIVKALPKPRIEIPVAEAWHENYVSKDQC